MSDLMFDMTIEQMVAEATKQCIAAQVKRSETQANADYIREQAGAYLDKASEQESDAIIGADMASAAQAEICNAARGDYSDIYASAQEAADRAYGRLLDYCADVDSANNELATTADALPA